MMRALLILGLLSLAQVARANDAASYSVKPDVVYGHKDGMALTMDVFEPKQNAKGIGVMFMVSGGWVSSWQPPDQTAGLLQPLLKAGYTVMAVRHGSSPRYIIPEVAQDVRLALKYVYEHAEDWNVDRDRLGVFGFSAGGHLSLLLGTRPDAATPNGQQESIPHVAAVVAVFPPTDLAPYVDPANPLRERFPALKFEPERAGDFSPLAQVSQDDAPTLLVHGDQDELVPLWHSEKIVEAFKEVNVAHKLIVIPGAGHGFDADGNRKMLENMVAWFDQQLDGKSK